MVLFLLYKRLGLIAVQRHFARAAVAALLALGAEMIVATVLGAPDADFRRRLAADGA
jgi:hypothetical protein